MNLKTSGQANKTTKYRSLKSYFSNKKIGRLERILEGEYGQKDENLDDFNVYFHFKYMPSNLNKKWPENIENRTTVTSNMDSK